MSSSPYATDKIVHHPDAVKAFAEHRSHDLNPLFVQLMPQNVCNHSCSFCSYRLPDWKNSTLFDESKAIPWEVCERLIDDFDRMGVKAVEVTGGGEPTAYPHFAELFRLLTLAEIETSLVTNGTLFDKEKIEAFVESDWKWARVSIDAELSETYSRIRKVSAHHMVRAWDSVRTLSDAKNSPDQRVGVGFVVTPDNYMEVHGACRRAQSMGADNIRISVAFVNEGADLLTDEQIQEVERQIGSAKATLQVRGFEVVDLFRERIDNLKDSPVQDYDYCGTKDVLCVIEGECNVYTCCTLAGDPRGLLGNVRDQSFVDLWRETREARRIFDVRSRCQCVCLYEKRNKVFLELRDPPPHVNFV
jgi:MoaA/NifB/PqqE/SkfB family radical SAM enzyme